MPYIILLTNCSPCCISYYDIFCMLFPYFYFVFELYSHFLSTLFCLILFSPHHKDNMSGRCDHRTVSASSTWQTNESHGGTWLITKPKRTVWSACKVEQCLTLVRWQMLKTMGLRSRSGRQGDKGALSSPGSCRHGNPVMSNLRKVHSNPTGYYTGYELDYVINQKIRV